MINKFRKLFKRVLCLILLLICFNNKSYSSEQFPKFSNWYKACKKLPKYRDLLKQDNLNYNNSCFKDYKELSNILLEFFSQEINGNFGDLHNWIITDNRFNLSENFFDPSKLYYEDNSLNFLPFAQKLKVKNSSQIILRGDLHGDIHSLVDQIKLWQKLGYMSSQDGFKINKKDFKILFLGDYTDRGLYGAEVIYTLLRLKLVNPNKVFLVRGNHEDIGLAERGGFLNELKAKFGNLNFNLIFKFHDYLPVVIYLGCGNNYIQCCHGGMEMGYNPNKLLDSDSNLKFEFLGELKQKDFIVKTKELDKFKLINKNIFNNFIPKAASGYFSPVGFMWNDFFVFDNNKNLNNCSSNDLYKSGSLSGRFSYSKLFTKLILDKQSSSKNKIRGVFRAHQHSAYKSDKLMQNLIKHNGVYSHWDIDYWHNLPKTRMLNKGKVWTFNVSPDSIYGHYCNYNFDAFAVANLFEDYNKSYLKIINN